MTIVFLIFLTLVITLCKYYYYNGAEQPMNDLVNDLVNDLADQ